MGMEGMAALAPCDAALRRGGLRVALAHDARPLDLVAADATQTRLALPGREVDRVKLFHGEELPVSRH